MKIIFLAKLLIFLLPSITLAEADISIVGLLKVTDTTVDNGTPSATLMFRWQENSTLIMPTWEFEKNKPCIYGEIEVFDENDNRVLMVLPVILKTPNGERKVTMGDLVIINYKYEGTIKFMKPGVYSAIGSYRTTTKDGRQVYIKTKKSWFHVSERKQKTA